MFLVEKEGSVQSVTQDAFERWMGIKYISKLQFIDRKCFEKVALINGKTLLRGEMSREQLWLGAYYQKELEEGDAKGLIVKWINAQIGWGIFTGRPFKANEFVAEYTGLVRKRHRSDVKNSYCYEYNTVIGEKTPYIIDAQDQAGLARFINHSDKANLSAVLATYAGFSHVILITKEPIPKGVQLCYDYGPDYWKKRPPPCILH